MKVYNSLGKEVSSLYNKEAKNIGIYELTWEPVGIPSGIYYIVMNYENHVQVRSVSFIK